jgi:hypothetical protein
MRRGEDLRAYLVTCQRSTVTLVANAWLDSALTRDYRATANPIQSLSAPPSTRRLLCSLLRCTAASLCYAVTGDSVLHSTVCVYGTLHLTSGGAMYRTRIVYAY